MFMPSFFLPFCSIWLLNTVFLQEKSVADAWFGYFQIPTKNWSTHKREWNSPSAGPSEEHLTDVYSCACSRKCQLTAGGSRVIDPNILSFRKHKRVGGSAARWAYHLQKQLDNALQIPGRKTPWTVNTDGHRSRCRNIILANARVGVKVSGALGLKLCSEACRGSPAHCSNSERSLRKLDWNQWADTSAQTWDSCTHLSNREFCWFRGLLALFWQRWRTHSLFWLTSLIPSVPSIRPMVLAKQHSFERCNSWPVGFCPTKCGPS